MLGTAFFHRQLYRTVYTPAGSGSRRARTQHQHQKTVSINNYGTAADNGSEAVPFTVSGIAFPTTSSQKGMLQHGIS
jgi:hypothetical protein